MKKLLDSSFVPPLLLLKQLSNHESSQTITSFSKSLDLDRRTILKAVQTLQNDISINNWHNLITLEVVDKNISATIGPLFSIDKFYAYYMSKSFNTMLVLHLFMRPTDSVEEAVAALYVSKTTFYRRISPLKQVLADFDLTLDFTSSENKIVGSEKQIRYFFYTFFWEIYRGIPFPNTKLSNNQKKELTKKLSTFDLPIAFIMMVELQVEIALHRFEQGYVMESFPKYELPELYMTYSDFGKLFSFYFSDLHSSSILDTELSALYFSMTTSTLYLQRTSNSLSVSHRYWSSSVTAIVHQWIFYFVDFFNLTLTHDEYFYLVVNLYLLQLKQTVLTGGSLSLGFNLLADILYEDNRYIYTQTNRFFYFINQQNSEFHVDKFHTFSYSLLLRRIIFKSLPVLNVLVCSKIGIEEQHWLEERISNISTVPIKFYSKWSDDLDLIISDFTLPENYIPKNPDSYFLWLAFSNFSEWIRLIKRLEKVYFSKI